MFFSTVRPRKSKAPGAVPDALSRSHVHRIGGDVLFVEQNAARVGSGEPDHHAEGRGLARAVRSEQADDLPRRDVEVDVADDHPAAVGLGQPFRAQRRHYFMSAFSGVSQAIASEVRRALVALAGSVIV